MGIIAAIHWHGSGNDKVLSCMIVDELTFEIYFGPKKYIMPVDDDKFNIKVNEIIKLFFDKVREINKIYKSDIKFEYKIVGNFQTGIRYNTRLDKPSVKTDYVDMVFSDSFIKIQSENFRCSKKRLRSDLSGVALQRFKKKLIEYGLINSINKDKYRWHLWALALHATNGRYEVQLKKLCKATKAEVDLENIQKSDELKKMRA